MKLRLLNITAVMTIFMVGCNGFLDIPSKTQFDGDTVFQTIERAEMAVLGA